MKFSSNNLALISLAALLFLGYAAYGQSSDQNFPTPVTTNEINGTVRVRDLGDARLTTYYYAFDGGQGDVFVNVVSKNFSGDIDIFSAESLQPLAKIVLYADAGTTETGRLVYLRKPQRLLLRVEGRTPDDSPATFRIKFGGSFIALQAQTVEEAPTIAKKETDNAAGITVNSVGTIVAVAPKPKPPIKTVEAGKADVEIAYSEPVRAEEPKPIKPPVKSSSTAVKPPAKGRAAAPEVKTVFGSKSSKKAEPPVVDSPEETVAAPVKNKTVKKPATASRPKAEVIVTESLPDPLAQIFLVIETKEGRTIRLPMSEVTRFSVDHGVLMVIGKDKTVTRYSILDVSKVTIQ